LDSGDERHRTALICLYCYPFSFCYSASRDLRTWNFKKRCLFSIGLSSLSPNLSSQSHGGRWVAWISLRTRFPTAKCKRSVGSINIYMTKSLFRSTILLLPLRMHPSLHHQEPSCGRNYSSNRGLFSCQIWVQF
jgi:hypothetical protein